MSQTVYRPDGSGGALEFLRLQFGDEFAVRFINRFAGRIFTIYSPSSSTRSADAIEIMDAFGADILDAIHEAYLRVPFIVPIARAFRVEFYTQRGLSSSHIVPLVGCSYRQVQHIRQKYRERSAIEKQREQKKRAK